MHMTPPSVARYRLPFATAMPSQTGNVFN
jgi:hypothetical protein